MDLSSCDYCQSQAAPPVPETCHLVSSLSFIPRSAMSETSQVRGREWNQTCQLGRGYSEELCRIKRLHRFSSISSGRAGVKGSESDRCTEWTVGFYWSSLWVYQRRRTQRHTATLIFKGRWARMRGNKKIIMPIDIHYSIDHRVTATYYLTVPQCHLVITCETEETHRHELGSGGGRVQTLLLE